MGKTYECPFYKWEERLAVHCEMAHVRFPDKVIRDRYLAQFCSAVPGWGHCTLARHMNLFYDGKDLDG